MEQQQCAISNIAYFSSFKTMHILCVNLLASVLYQTNPEIPSYFGLVP